MSGQMSFTPNANSSLRDSSGGAALEREPKVLVGFLRHGRHAAVDQLRAPAPRFLAASAPQRSWSDVRKSEIAVHSTRLPVARIARVDENDRAEIAGEPHGGGEPAGPPPMMATS
jgi:hypothetical protein